MSQHVPETCAVDELWLPLTEYSVKSGVSTSTIRRKIKNNSISYRLEKGRYLILFNGKPMTDVGNQTLTPAHIPTPEEPQAPRDNPVKTVGKETKTYNERLLLPLVECSVKMVSEAFEHTLKEKDERIRLLEKRNQDLDDRLNELRTLVRVLEEKYSVRY